MTDPSSFAMVAVFAAISGVIGISRRIRAARARAAVRREVDAANTDASDHEAVTLVGIVVAPAELLTAPLTGTPCVAFAARARIFGWGPGQEDERTALNMLAFTLDTKDGPVAVESSPPWIDLPLDQTPLDPPRERAFLATHGVSPDLMPRTSFREAVVTPGMHVRVHGMAVFETAPSDGDYRATGRPIVRVVGRPGHPIVIGLPR